MSDPRPPKAERDELAEKILLWVSTRLHPALAAGAAQPRRRATAGVARRAE